MDIVEGYYFVYYISLRPEENKLGLVLEAMGSLEWCQWWGLSCPNHVATDGREDPQALDAAPMGIGLGVLGRAPKFQSHWQVVR